MWKTVRNTGCGLLVLFVVTAAGANGGAAETGSTEPRIRLWSSKAGTYLRATFVRVEGENVVWMKEEGGEVSVPTSQLSKPDQDYVAKQKLAGSGMEAPRPNELLEKCQELSKELVKSHTGTNPAVKNTIAVVELSDLSGGATDLGRIISEELVTAFVKTGKYRVIERLLLNKVIAEHGLPVQGIVDPKSAKELGKILGVDVLVSSTIKDMGDSARVNARLISIERGELFSAAAVSISKDGVTRTIGDGGNRAGDVPPPRRKVQVPYREDFTD